MQICDYCEKGTVFEAKGEYVCDWCAAVSRDPVLVHDVMVFEEANALLRYDATSSITTAPVSSSQRRIKSRTIDVKHIVQQQLRLLDPVANEMESLYNKYIASGVRPDGEKHILIMGVCAYLASEARDCKQICMDLGQDIHEFHSMYSTVTNKIKVKKAEMGYEDSIKVVCNKLALNGIKAAAFRKACYKLYDKATKVPHGREMFKQLNNTKLFAVIGMLALKMTKTDLGMSDAQLLAALDISKPTVKKIKGIVLGLVMEANASCS